MTKLDVVSATVVVMAIIILAFVLGHVIGFNEALDATYQDTQGRQCISVEMYRPTDAQIEKGQHYGDSTGSAGRGGYIFCEVNDEPNITN